ncbi:MAG: hypothetical protein HQL30_09255 [Candidatus Omnitrophica bacterium]|nr:hypothetical protein [Candidatus Omnitrophota bacterium]
MILIPYEKFEIQTAKSDTEVLGKIAQLTDGPSLKLLFYPPADSKPFVGTITGSRFKIRRIIRYRNSFMPIICGRVENSTLFLTARLHAIVAVFMSLWLSGVFFAFIGSFIPGIDENSPTAPVVLRMGSGAMFIFGYLLCLLSFRFELKKAKKILEGYFYKD